MEDAESVIFSPFEIKKNLDRRDDKREYPNNGNKFRTEKSCLK